MEEITNPHDKLFKEIQKVKDNSRDLIESTFPAELLQGLDLKTLENDNNSYIDSSLKEYYSDLVFNCLYKNSTEIKISILFEHKSYKPENEYVQLLQYIINIWKFAIKDKEKPPVVIPVIFYHGKEKWEIKPLHSYFTGIDEILKQFIPAFKYILTDLSKIPDEAIIKEKFKNNINKVMALLFKHMSDEDYIKNQLKAIFLLIKDYFSDKKKDVVISFLIYIMSITEIEDSYIDDCLSTISPEGGRISMTTAMKLRQEGRQEGHQEGIQEGRKETKLEDARKMLENGADVEFVIKVTGLSIQEIEQIQKSIL